MRNILIGLITIWLVGCANLPTLNAGAEVVKVTTSKDDVASCQSIAMVNGYSDNGFDGYAGKDGVAQQRATYVLQNKTHELNGNVVHITNINTLEGGSSLTGMAYKC